jgi:Fe(3+) dicitrate transport protein
MSPVIPCPRLRRPALLLGLLTACMAGHGGPLWAQDGGEDERLEVITIIARPTDPLAVPGSSYVITETELQALAYTDVHRMLQAAPGVYVKDEEGLGLFPNIGIRGASSGRSSKITVLEDGLPGAMAPYASPASYVFPTAGRMRGIEVLKGPGTLRHGPFTVGGAINLLSTAIPATGTARIVAELGSFGGEKLQASYGGSVGQWGALLETYQKSSNGFARIDRIGGDTGHDLDEYVGKLRWSSADSAPWRQQLELKFVHADETADQSYIGLTDADFRLDPNRRYGLTALDRIDRSRSGGSLRHVLDFSASLRLTSSVYRWDNTRDFARLTQIAGQDITTFVNAANTDPQRQAILGGADVANLQHQLNYRTFLAQGLQSELAARFSIGEVDHDLVAGLRLHEDEEDRLQPTDIYDQVNGRLVYRRTLPANASNNRIGEAKAVSAWLLDQASLGRWRLSGGLRYEDIRTAEQRYVDVARTVPGQRVANSLSKLSVGGGATFAMGERWSLLAGIHQGFAPPGSGATSGQLGEESVNSELGLRFRSGNLSIDAVGFFSDYTNALQNCTLANPCAGGIVDGTEQTGAAEVFGFEFLAETTLFSGSAFTVPARLSWTWTQGEVTRDSDTRNVLQGDSLPYLPEHVAAASIGVERGRAALHAAAHYTAAQCADSLCNRPGIDNRFRRTESYLTVDLAASWQLTPGAQLYARVENLLDEQRLVSRGAAGARTNMPRYFGAGLRVEF